jgi:hypothetical protein
MPDEKPPLPPVVNHAIRIGLGVAARATARFVDSVLKDMGAAFGAGEKAVRRRRQRIDQKLKESGAYEDDDGGNVG